MKHSNSLGVSKGNGINFPPFTVLKETPSELSNKGNDKLCEYNQEWKLSISSLIIDDTDL